jgi:hypothetical protein
MVEGGGLKVERWKVASGYQRCVAASGVDRGDRGADAVGRGIEPGRAASAPMMRVRASGESASDEREREAVDELVGCRDERQHFRVVERDVWRGAERIAVRKFGIEMAVVGENPILGREAGGGEQAGLHVGGLKKLNTVGAQRGLGERALRVGDAVATGGLGGVERAQQGGVARLLVPNAALAATVGVGLRSRAGGADDGADVPAHAGAVVLKGPCDAVDIGGSAARNEALIICRAKAARRSGG